MYYWPNIWYDLKQGYIASCLDCQPNKSSTTKPYGPLHPLPVPDQWGDSVAINFTGPLLEDEGKNCIITFTDQLGSNIQLVPTWTGITTEDLAYLFFDKWYCENGLPLIHVAWGWTWKCVKHNKDQVPQEKNLITTHTHTHNLGMKVWGLWYWKISLVSLKVSIVSF